MRGGGLGRVCSTQFYSGPTLLHSEAPPYALELPPDPLCLAMPGAREGHYGGGSQWMRVPRLGHRAPGLDSHSAKEKSPNCRGGWEMCSPWDPGPNGDGIGGQGAGALPHPHLERGCAFKHLNVFKKQSVQFYYNKNTGLPVTM